MSGRIACITCTGDRPFPLSLCRKYIERSTVMPDLWMVVDDGADPETRMVVKGYAGPEIFYVKRERGCKEPKHTLPLNTAAALRNLPANIEWVVFWEDDDWYSPAYLSWVMKTIEENPHAVLIGQSHAHYYRVMSKEYQILGNDKHASMCATAIHCSMLPRLEQICVDSIDPFLDIHMWNECVTQGRTVVLEAHPHVVGIKEMPGRRSTTYGWRGGPDFVKDVHGTTLQRWVGVDDAAVYMELSRKRKG